jgi:hypothetical protein
MSGTRKPIKPPIKEGKEERSQSASTRSAKNAVKKASLKKNVAGRTGIVKKNIKSKKPLSYARLAAERKSAYTRQKEGKIFTKGKDGSLASWDIQRIKWEILNNEVNTRKKQTPAQRKKTRDNTIKKGKPS